MILLIFCTPILSTHNLLKYLQNYKTVNKIWKKKETRRIRFYPASGQVSVEDFLKTGF